jgi:hypothetical protein
MQGALLTATNCDTGLVGGVRGFDVRVMHHANAQVCSPGWCSSGGGEERRSKNCDSELRLHDLSSWLADLTVFSYDIRVIQPGWIWSFRLRG